MLDFPRFLFCRSPFSSVSPTPSLRFFFRPKALSRASRIEIFVISAAIQRAGQKGAFRKKKKSLNSRRSSGAASSRGSGSAAADTRNPASRINGGDECHKRVMTLRASGTEEKGASPSDRQREIPRRCGLSVVPLTGTTGSVVVVPLLSCPFRYFRRYPSEPGYGDSKRASRRRLPTRPMRLSQTACAELCP